MKKKLHILFICGWYPSKILPNNGDFIQRHAEAVSLNHNVSVLHIISSKNCYKKIEITRKKINNINTHIAYLKTSRNRVIKIFRFWKAYKMLLTEILEFDLVHLNKLYPFGLFALHLKLKNKIPYIISEHWTGYLKSNKISFFEKYLSKKIVRNSEFICPVSNQLKLDMQKLGLVGQYSTIGNVVDTHIFSPLNRKNERFTIIHVSSFNDNSKNISGMLKVAKLLENKIEQFTWKFIGGSSEKYKKLIAKLEFKTARIEFQSHVEQKTLASLLQKANVYVSFSNYETFGIVMTEAIACGTPVISTNTGILNESSREGFFKIIPKNDQKSLSNAIFTLYQSNNQLNVQEMHSYVDSKFSKNVISKMFSNIYYKSLNL